jgi:hypothetical protein
VGALLQGMGPTLVGFAIQGSLKYGFYDVFKQVTHIPCCFFFIFFFTFFYFSFLFFFTFFYLSFSSFFPFFLSFSINFEAILRVCKYKI